MEIYHNAAAEANKLHNIDMKIGKTLISREEIDFLSTLDYKDMGPYLYYVLMKLELIQNKNVTKGEEWFNLYLKTANGESLMHAVDDLLSFKDDYLDYALRCLAKAASKKNKRAVALMKVIKLHVFDEID